MMEEGEVLRRLRSAQLGAAARWWRVFPNDRLEAVAAQLEYYFGDENLPTDDFLLVKTMKKDPGAFVPIKVLLTFPRLKRQKVDEMVVAAAVAWRESSGQGSNLLQLSANRRKVRRVAGLDELPIHLVRVENLSKDIKDKDQAKFLERYFETKYGPSKDQHNKSKDLPRAVVNVRFVKPPSRRAYCLVALQSDALVEQAVHDHADADWRTDMLVKRESLVLTRKQTGPNGTEEPDSERENSDQVDEKAKSQEIKRVFEGKIRTLDAANLEGFIAPFAPNNNTSGRGRGKGRRSGKGKGKGASSRPPKSVFFACHDQEVLFRQLKVGTKVRYTWTAGQPPLVSNLEILSSTDDYLKEEQGADADSGRPTFRLKARAVKEDPTAAPVNANCGYYAKGPVNKADYLGFTSVEWRGIDRKRKEHS